MNRTVSIAVTVITALCCGCMALMSCIFGGMIAGGVPFNQELNGVSSVQTYPPMVGYSLICVSVILLIIPIAVGFFTLRNKPAAAVSPVAQNYNGPIPPAS
jgi:hypothetical protein